MEMNILETFAFLKGKSPVYIQRGGDPHPPKSSQKQYSMK